ncbi:Transmembrane protein 17B [Liparis tanakae]|uniref:Transmembrane protein 17B n=1 Tax=Liparis tanakae TaxID=230148 RepID=A0A4Z2H2H6_9TELE|nr:Transmembrane protein 17B [Liparis tanakae]
MDLPEALRRRLEDFSRTVLFNQSGTQPCAEENDAQAGAVESPPPDVAVLQHYPALPDYYKFILVTVLILMTLIEAIRLFLGYAGNLQEKVPELAGFWLLSTLLQFPLILFQLFNEAILIQPLERGVHIVLSMFILTQALYGFLALRDMVRHTRRQFHLQQFD